VQRPQGANFASIDPETGDRVNLFNPRQDTWERHFEVDVGGHIIGLIPTGRATVRLLDMNGIPQLNLRQMLIAGGEFDWRAQPRTARFWMRSCSTTAHSSASPNRTRGRLPPSNRSAQGRFRTR
jgi:hypothetical protein